MNFSDPAILHRYSEVASKVAGQRLTGGYEPRPNIVATEVRQTFVLARVVRNCCDLVRLLRCADLVEMFPERKRRISRRAGVRLGTDTRRFAHRHTATHDDLHNLKRHALLDLL